MIEFTGQVALVTGSGRDLGRLYALDLARRFGRLDVVISNAGIFNSIAFDDLSVEDWRRMLGVHLDGGFHLSQPAFRVMKSRGGGRFVFVSSSAGMFGQPMEAHYAAAKTGLVGLSNVIAVEGAAHGRLSNTVLPNGFSRMVAETVGDEKFLTESGFMRAIRAELVVPLVVFLASRACTLSHPNYSASAGTTRGSSSAWAEAGRRVPTTPHRRRHRDPSWRGVGDRAVHRPRVDSRRGPRCL